MSYAEHLFVPSKGNEYLCGHVVASGCFSMRHCYQTKDAAIHAPTRIKEIVAKVMAEQAEPLPADHEEKKG